MASAVAVRVGVRVGVRVNVGVNVGVECGCRVSRVLTVIFHVRLNRLLNAFFFVRTGFRNPHIFSVGGDQRSTRDERGGVRRGVDERVLRALLPRDRVRGTVVVFQGA